MSRATVELEGRIKLKPGREGPVRAGHPWVFSGAIAEVDGSLEPGATVRVESGDGTPLGVGFYNPRGSIAVRLLAREDVSVDAALVRRRVGEALDLRCRLGLVQPGSAYRLLNGEGDWLPGVVVDVYDRFAVVQLLNAGAERLREALLDALGAAIAPRGVFERSAGGARREEGLADRIEVAIGEDPPERIEIAEGEARLLVDVQHGQKTGFFLDQRSNRELLGKLSSGLRILDAFSYTGGFAIAAGLGGAAHVTCVETSGPAVTLAKENWTRSGLSPDKVEWLGADVFDALEAAGKGEPFDLIVLDPPPFARHRADRDRAVRAYRDLNRRALRALAPGGLLLTCSCSPHIPRDVFAHVVATAAAPGARLQTLAQLGAAPDHPILPAHGEGEYLCGLLVRRSTD